jgi:hypothetical protein
MSAKEVGLNYTCMWFFFCVLQDMKRKIREFVKGREHSRYDSCVVAIMSHGREGLCKQDSTIVTAEGQELKIEWVLEQFNNENAPSLRRKPKIFFFQTCRCDLLH